MLWNFGDKMRLLSPLGHPLDHSALTNVLPDQHHDRPINIEVSNTTLNIYPLPGGPGQWDIAMPLNARIVKFSFQSNKVIAEGSGKAGVHGIATRSQFETTTFSLGGHGTTTTTAYNACYSKKASTMNLSHKVFASVGYYISLTEAYLTLISASERVFRTVWTNYGASIYTLHCIGQVQVIG
jgi:hypothetical protein